MALISCRYCFNMNSDINLLNLKYISHKVKTVKFNDKEDKM